MSIFSLPPIHLESLLTLQPIFIEKTIRLNDLSSDNYKGILT